MHACTHAVYGVNKNIDNTNSEERERHRGAYGDIDSSEARERCMLGWKGFPIGREKVGELGASAEREEKTFMSPAYLLPLK